MTINESVHWPTPEEPGIEVSIPVEPDDDWCLGFSNRYGRRGYRAEVIASFCLQEVQSAICYRRPLTRSFHKLEAPDSMMGGSFTLEGEVLGARIASLWDEKLEDFFKVPLVMMVDAVPVEWDYRGMLMLPDQEVWVPIDDTGGKLTLN